MKSLKYECVKPWSGTRSVVLIQPVPIDVISSGDIDTNEAF